jgi:drug/metabolite transporter (DMT)-like permease
MAQAKLQPPVDPAVGSESQTPRSSTVLVVLAFATVYLVWGSTYLAIRYAIETLPPFLMAATRFLVAGTILFAWATFKHGPIFTFAHWRKAFVVGALLLLCGNGGVTWAEKFIPSGLAALLIASEPLWVVVLNWMLMRRRPNFKVLAGVLFGLVGVALLVGRGFRSGAGSSFMGLVGAGVILLSSVAWAGGSVYANRRPIRIPTSMASGMQMLVGGCLLLLAGLVNGDLSGLQLGQTSWVSIIAFLYLTLFGSLLAFTAYSWLLKNVAPTRAVTYAYVNPVVAVLLGWLIAGESLTLSMLLGATVIVGSVVLITTFGTDTVE